MPRGLPNLAFSTRSRHPTGGADAVREVIATSPGVSEAARREFASRADLGGSLLHAELTGPVHSFSAVDDANWLFCRAVSLGRYRKGAHQFLVHGVLLTVDDLARVDANPFLLDGGEGGLELLGEHPGAGTELPLLAPPTIARDVARQANRRRFDELAAELGGEDGWFAAAWEAVTRGERVALVDPRPTSTPIEWLLLHLHPDDRPLVGFHSWYSHGRPLAYELLVTAPQESARVRSQFRGVRLVDRAAAGGDGTGPGALARRLRERDPEAFLDLLRDVHLTRLARRPLPPLDEADAALCLRAALAGDAALDAAERHRLDLLRLRSEPAGRLRYAVGDLAAAWREGAADFASRLAPMAATVEVGPAAVAAVAAALARRGAPADGDERWALLALLDAAAERRADDDLEAARTQTWRSSVAPGGFDELVAPFDETRAVAAEPVLRRFVLAEAEVEVAAAGRGGRGGGANGRGDAGDPAAAPGAAADWSAFLAWLTSRGHWDRELADRIERMAATAPPPLARAWLRRLGELHAITGERGEALRLWLGGEAPRLDGEARRRRVEAVVGWSLDGEPDASDDRLDRFLEHPEVGDTVATAVATWAAVRPDPDATWRRLQPRVASWRLGASTAPAVGALLAGLAVSPSADRLSQLASTLVTAAGTADPGSFLGISLSRAAHRLTPQVAAAQGAAERRRMVAAAAELLRVRNGHPGAAAADGPLLRLALPALIAAQELVAGDRAAAGTVSRFREAWTGLLASRAARRLDGPEAPDGLDAAVEEDWLDLLLDDFAVEPLAAADSDPRYHFFLVLGLRAWVADPSTRRRLRLGRGLRLAPVPPTGGWHHERVAAVVPAGLADEADRLLTLPPRPAGDNLRGW